MEPAQIVLVVCVVAFTGVAAALDLKTRRIPNALTVAGLVAGILFQVIVGASRAGMSGAGAGFVDALAGFLTGFGILLVLWLIGGGGGGDVKLMGALGAWLGPRDTMYVFLVCVAMIGVGSIIWLIFRTTYARLGSGKPRNGKPADLPQLRKAMVPFGLPLALATWCVLAYEIMKNSS